MLDASVIEERFEYDTEKGSLGGDGINVAFVRVYRLEPQVTLPMEQRFGGCRSWVELPEIDPGTLVSVISDEEHAVLVAQRPQAEQVFRRGGRDAALALHALDQNRRRGG